MEFSSGLKCLIHLSFESMNLSGKHLTWDFFFLSSLVSAKRMSCMASHIESDTQKGGGRTPSGSCRISW